MKVIVDIPYDIGTKIKCIFRNVWFTGVVEFYRYKFVIRVLDGEYYFSDIHNGLDKDGNKIDYIYLSSVMNYANIVIL